MPATLTRQMDARAGLELLRATSHFIRHPCAGSTEWRRLAAAIEPRGITREPVVATATEMQERVQGLGELSVGAQRPEHKRFAAVSAAAKRRAPRTDCPRPPTATLPRDGRPAATS
jgi:hypothetical protein